MRKLTNISYKRIPNSKYGRNDGNRKTTLDHCSNNCFQQCPRMDAKINEQNVKEKQDK